MENVLDLFFIMVGGLINISSKILGIGQKVKPYRSDKSVGRASLLCYLFLRFMDAE